MKRDDKVVISANESETYVQVKIGVQLCRDEPID